MRAASFLVAAVSLHVPTVQRDSHANLALFYAFSTPQFAASLANAARIQVLIGANKTANASQIFQPQQIRAQAGDVVVFNCE